MFDMGFAELLLIAVVGLLVIGPKRMPDAIRVLGYWLGKLRRTVNNARREMEQEFGLDDIRRDLHNEELLAQFKKEREQVKHSLMTAPPKLDVPEPADETNEADDREMLQAFDDFDNEFGFSHDTEDNNVTEVESATGAEPGASAEQVKNQVMKQATDQSTNQTAAPEKP